MYNHRNIGRAWHQHSRLFSVPPRYVVPRVLSSATNEGRIPHNGHDSGSIRYLLGCLAPWSQGTDLGDQGENNSYAAELYHQFAAQSQNQPVPGCVYACMRVFVAGSSRGFVYGVVWGYRVSARCCASSVFVCFTRDAVIDRWSFVNSFPNSQSSCGWQMAWLTSRTWCTSNRRLWSWLRFRISLRLNPWRIPSSLPPPFHLPRTSSCGSASDSESISRSESTRPSSNSNPQPSMRSASQPVAPRAPRWTCEWPLPVPGQR